MECKRGKIIYRKIFVTFADERLKKSLNRISEQADKMGVFDEVISMSQNDLSPQFLDEFRACLSPKIRGYGYWVWKPQVLLQTLNSANEGDVILYTDVGCHLNVRGKERLIEYFEITSKANPGILAFQAFRPSFPLVDDGREIPHWIDKDWTKGDLLDHFNVRNDNSIINTPTIQSGVLFIRKEDKTIKIIEKWLDTYRQSFALVDDSTSKSPNFPTFVEHRHDQSVFSILAKQNGVTTVSASEFWIPKTPGSPKGDWLYLDKYPIHAKRDLDFGYWGNITKRIDKQIKFEKKRIKNFLGRNYSFDQ